MRKAFGVNHKNIPALALNLVDDDRRFVFPSNKDLTKDEIID